MAALQKQECIWPIPPTPVTAVSSSRTGPQWWPLSAPTYPRFRPEWWSGRREKIGFYCITVLQCQWRDTCSSVQIRCRGKQVSGMQTRPRNGNFTCFDKDSAWAKMVMGGNSWGSGMLLLELMRSLSFCTANRRERDGNNKPLSQRVCGSVCRGADSIKLQERQESLQLIFRKITTWAGISRTSQILTCQDPEQHARKTHDWVS